MNDKSIGIIPARLDSKRLPGKLLADLNGKSVIQHTFESASKAKLLDKLVISTGDPKIFNHSIKFADNLFINVTKPKNGTERVAEACRMYDADIIINIQGDEPFIHPSMIDDLVKVMRKYPEINIATIGTKIRSIHDLHDESVVKLTVNWKGYATIFTREPLWAWGVYKHIGIYAYRKDFLLKLVNMEPTENEKKYKLEQLRVFDNGYKIKVVKSKYDTIAIDNRIDLRKAREWIEKNLKK